VAVRAVRWWHLTRPKFSDRGRERAWLLVRSCNYAKVTHQSGPRFAGSAWLGVRVLEKSVIRETGLESDQLGELGRDVGHQHFCSVEAVSRGEHGADFAESFVRRVMYDGNKLVTR